MKNPLTLALVVLFAGSLVANEVTPFEGSGKRVLEDPDASGEIADAQPKLVRITGMIDGSGRVIFTRQAVRYEHKHWAPPTKMNFDGEPWTDLKRTPPAWLNVAPHLDLTKAWIVKRKGRDSVSLEVTPDGFDLYLSDSPNGASPYEVTIAIPRRR